MDVVSNTAKNSCVVPVCAVDALAWAAGQLKDVDLLTRSPLVPEGVFIVDLPDRHSYRETLERVLYWYLRGAVFLIARTGTEVVDRHMEIKNGCLRMFREDTSPVKYRFLCPPEHFKSWVKKWGRANLKRTATIL